MVSPLRTNFVERTQACAHFTTQDSDVAQGHDRHGQRALVLEERDVEQGRRADHLFADLAQQGGCRFDGAAGGQHVVDDQHALALDPFRLDLDGRAAVFALVIDADRLAGQFTCLARHGEADLVLQRERAGNHESARVHGQDEIEVQVIGLRVQGVDGDAPMFRVIENAADVDEIDARFRVVLEEFQWNIVEIVHVK